MKEFDDKVFENNGASKYQIKSIVLQSGEIIDLIDIVYSLVIKECNIDDKQSVYNFSYNIKQDNDLKALSNNNYLLAATFRNMSVYGESFNKAMEIHNIAISKAIKDKKNKSI